ncbi:hypothetical protein TNCV_1163341 [Trichonephila clavipes]|nr:hypothetical protein TNCV_1163341 [Trichonephila clavipes]
MIVQFRNEKVSNHGSIPITIDCNVVAFIVFEEGFHQPIKRTKQCSLNMGDHIHKKKLIYIGVTGIITVGFCSTHGDQELDASVSMPSNHIATEDLQYRVGL